MRLNLDLGLTLSYLASSVLGLLLIGSVSPDRLLQHALVLLLGFVLYVYASTQSHTLYSSFTLLLYLLSVLALLSTFIFTTITRGTTSWLELGPVRFQPSELAKPLLILAFSSFLSHFPPKHLRNILLNLALFAVPTSLILAQPDLGTALILALIFLTQLTIASVPARYLGLAVAILILILPLLPNLLRPYQYARLTSFLDPSRDPLGSGYNVIQSIIAIGSGGVFGKGLGHGTQSHLRFLPERHTDFAFASLGEELGLIGTMSILFVISIPIFRLLSATTHARLTHIRLTLAGICAYYTFQSLLNIAGNLGLAPITGITLPLISYGGSSILATSLALGIANSLISASRRPPLLEIR